MQRHGVGSYVHSVRAGCHYFYRVLAPQRATVEIELSRGEPGIGDLRLAGNARPSRAVAKAVKRWFRAACAEAMKSAGA